MVPLAAKGKYLCLPTAMHHTSDRYLRIVCLLAPVASLAILAACRSDSSVSEDAPMLLRPAILVDGEQIERPEHVAAMVVRDDNTVHLCSDGWDADAQDGEELVVYSDAQLKGCGVKDSRVWISTVYDGKILLSSTDIRWRPSSKPVIRDVDFAQADTDGIASPFTLLTLDFYPALTEMQNVSARIGTTVCGYAPAIDNDRDFRYVFLAVSGPDLIPGCERDAVIDIVTATETHAAVTANDFQISSARPVVTIGGPASGNPP